MEQTAYLAALRRELVAAEKLQKDSVLDIKAEIERVEDDLASKPKAVANAVGRRVEKSAATVVDKLRSYMAALQKEIRGVDPASERGKAVQAEIDRTKIELEDYEAPISDREPDEDEDEDEDEGPAKAKATRVSPKARAAHRGAGS